MIHTGESEVDEPIEAGEWLEESLPVEPGGTLFVRSARGDVDVRSHDTDEVRIEAEARGRRAQQVRFHVERSGNDVRFEVRTDGWLVGLFGSLGVRVRIWLPRRYSLVLRTRGGDVRVDGITGDVTLETSGGDASVTRTVGPIELSSSGGNLEIEHVDGDVRAKTSGGNVTLRDVFGDVRARSSGGELEIDGVDGAVELRSSGGSASIVFLGDPQGEIASSGGALQVLFRDGARCELDARSSGGGIALDVELDRVWEQSAQRVRGVLGDDGPKLKLRSAGGGIHIGLI
jgi:DUF4097 and DUF4098 domain-containing protein YvlB